METDEKKGMIWWMLVAVVVVGTGDRVLCSIIATTQQQNSHKTQLQHGKIYACMRKYVKMIKASSAESAARNKQNKQNPTKQVLEV